MGGGGLCNWQTIRSYELRFNKEGRSYELRFNKEGRSYELNFNKEGRSYVF